jgi:hypothetical protein
MLSCEDDCDDWFEAELSVDQEISSPARETEPLDSVGHANPITQHGAVPKPAVSAGPDTAPRGWHIAFIY